MRKLLVVPVLVLALTSCSVVEALKETAQQTNELVKTTKELVVTSKAAFTEARAKADTNKDGTTTFGEWWQYLLLVLGVGTPAGGAVIAIRNAKSNARKAIVEHEVEGVKNAIREAGLVSMPHLREVTKPRDASRTPSV